MTCGCGENITQEAEQESNKRCLSEPHCSECLEILDEAREYKIKYGRRVGDETKSSDETKDETLPDPNCPFCAIARRMGKVIWCGHCMRKK